MVTTKSVLRFLQNSHTTPQSITFFCLCGRRCFRPRSWLSMSISEHLPPTPTTQGGIGKHSSHNKKKNTFTFFPLVCKYPETSMKRNEKGGETKWERWWECLYLVLVEIRQLHFSQGVFQVAEHKLLNLVVVCGPHFLDSHTNTGALEHANETNLQWTTCPTARRYYLLRLQEEALEVVEGDPLFWSVNEPARKSDGSLQ